jgi:3'(2'), 5'-bisphosphate nucleotidase
MSADATLRDAIVHIARDAGHAIMQVYAQDFAVHSKDDESPLTAADMAAHHLIVDGLAALTPDIPILSEESANIPWSIRREWRRYWLVDPLDGTREFVKRNGEFTVNIALIEAGVPTLGIVYAPALDYLVHGQRGHGAFLRDGGDDVALSTARPAAAPLRVAASRSHLDPRTQRVLERIGEHERLGLGSSLKFCRIAEGRVDFYPRFGPTSEWDTAAGQCVLEAAGGAVLDVHGNALAYNAKDSILNSDFLALGDTALPWRQWLDA